jgi:hypothetical protein
MKFWWIVAALLGPRHFLRYVLLSLLGGAFLFYCLIHR